MYKHQGSSPVTYLGTDAPKALMGVAASDLGDKNAVIDELHTVVTFAEDDVQRRLALLRSVQRASRISGTSRAIVEQGGLIPLIKCFSSPHPEVQLEASQALQILAQDPANYAELGTQDVLQRLIPILLTSDNDRARSHTIAALALVCEQTESNQLHAVLEGLLDPLLEAAAAANASLVRNALGALSTLCRVFSVSVLAARRGAASKILFAARAADETTKLSALRVLTGLATISENIAPVINSGCLVFIISCTSVPVLRLEAARCLEVLLRNVFEGAYLLTHREAKRLAALSGILLNRERMREDYEESFDMRNALNKVAKGFLLPQPLPLLLSLPLLPLLPS
jgi:hypothetical protein